MPRAPAAAQIGIPGTHGAALAIRRSSDRGVAELYGSTCGLLFFSAMILRGLAVGNPPESVLARALGGLAMGFVLGAIAGVIAARVVRENAAARTNDDKDQEAGRVPDQRQQNAARAA